MFIKWGLAEKSSLGWASKEAQDFSRQTGKVTEEEGICKTQKQESAKVQKKLGIGEEEIPTPTRKTVVLFTFQSAQSPAYCLHKMELNLPGKGWNEAGGRWQWVLWGRGTGESGTLAKEPSQGPHSNYFTHITFYDTEYKNTKAGSGLDLVTAHFHLKSKLKEIINMMRM